MPAAVPAEVRTWPSSMYSTDGSTLTLGNIWAMSPAYIQCGRGPFAVEQAGVGEHEGPEQSEAISDPRSWAARSASSRWSGGSSRTAFWPFNAPYAGEFLGTHMLPRKNHFLHCDLLESARGLWKLPTQCRDR